MPPDATEGLTSTGSRYVLKPRLSCVVLFETFSGDGDDAHPLPVQADALEMTASYRASSPVGGNVGHAVRSTSRSPFRKS